MISITLSNAQISASIAPAIAAAVVDTALDSDELQDLANVTSLVGAPAAPATDPNKAQVVVTEENIACNVSGSFDITYDINNPQNIGIGDSISVNFVDCDEGDGAVLNGGFGLTIAELTGDLSSSQFLFGFLMNLSDFTIVDQSTTVLTGDIDFSIDTLTPQVIEIAFSGSSMSIIDDNVITSLHDFSSAITVDDTQPSVTIVASGLVMSSKFDGAAGFDTTVPFQIVGGNQYPSSGELTIEGSDDISMKVVAVNNTDVDLLLDLNGDDIYDATINTTWAAGHLSKYLSFSRYRAPLIAAPFLLRP